MTRALQQLLVGLALTLVAFAGVLWQIEQSGALRTPDAQAQRAGDTTIHPRSDQHVSLPRLICPLH